MCAVPSMPEKMDRFEQLSCEGPGPHTTSPSSSSTHAGARGETATADGGARGTGHGMMDVVWIGLALH